MARNPVSRARGGKRSRKALNDRYRAKIRMYRQGLGDCFLITLPGKDTTRSRKPYHIMIDCGVIIGTHDAADNMTGVVEDIVAATGGTVDLLIVTHEHWDHVSGFVQAKQSFQKLKINELWLAWTEDPKDPLANKLRGERENALAALRLGLSRLHFGDANAAQEIDGLLNFFGAARGPSTKDALDEAKKLARMIRYLTPGENPIDLSGGVKAFVLGPPKDEKWLRKINPSKRDKETYGLALAGLPLFLEGPKSALKKEGEDTDRPFNSIFEIPFPIANGMSFFKEYYWTPDASDQEWRRIDTAWLLGLDELALQLDSLTNNTSLALAFALANGDVLLFAADAQVGNWLSWEELKWTIKDDTVTAPQLLEKAIFYKVGHHASHNATLKEKGLELMHNLRVAMIPVDQKVARKKRWNNMPLPELIEALDRQADLVVRSDEPLPRTNERLTASDLYYELTL